MKQVYLPLAIGIVGFAIAATLLIGGGQLISAVQVEVSDLFMVRAKTLSRSAYNCGEH